MASISDFKDIDKSTRRSDPRLYAPSRSTLHFHRKQPHFSVDNASLICCAVTVIGIVLDKTVKHRQVDVVMATKRRDKTI